MRQLAQLTTSADSTADATARELLDTLPVVMWFVRSRMRTHRGGMSMARFRALVHIERERDAAVSNVAEHLAVTRATASRVVSGLVDDGFVRRAPTNASDRRRIGLSLTPSGKAILRSAQNHARKLLADEMAGMSVGERRALSVAMRLLRGRFGAVSESGAAVELR